VGFRPPAPVSDIPKLLPGTYTIATIVVNAEGRIVAVTAGTPPATAAPFPRVPNVPEGDRKVEGTNEPDEKVTNYVIFHEVPFKSGEVHTAWRFADNFATEPNRQWCYYTRTNPETGLGSDINLELDPTVEAMKAVQFSGDDYQKAAALCQWFQGKKPSN
jgi:hypothetical protein